MSAQVTAVYRYPVKGLSPEALGSTTLEPGLGIAGDRRFALALGATPFDREKPEWHHKAGFLQLMQHARLKQLETRFDDADNTLTVLRGGRQVAKGNLGLPVGRAMIAEFFDAYMRDDISGGLRVVEGPAGYMFSDHKNRVVSLIGLRSIADLERVVGRPVDPERFRANVLFDGAPAWAEFGWLDKEITIGEARLKVTARIDRCAATNVDPVTAERDMNIPKALMRGFGHVDMGVYAQVLAPGRIAPGDAVEIVG